MRTLSRRRVVVAALSLAVIPVAAGAPVLVALTLLAALWSALITYEVVRFRDARQRLHAAAAHD